MPYCFLGSSIKVTWREWGLWPSICCCVVRTVTWLPMWSKMADVYLDGTPSRMSWTENCHVPDCSHGHPWLILYLPKCLFSDEFTKTSEIAVKSSEITSRGQKSQLSVEENCISCLFKSVDEKYLPFIMQSSYLSSHWFRQGGSKAYWFCWLIIFLPFCYAFTWTAWFSKQ